MSEKNIGRPSLPDWVMRNRLIIAPLALIIAVGSILYLESQGDDLLGGNVPKRTCIYDSPVNRIGFDLPFRQTCPKFVLFAFTIHNSFNKIPLEKRAGDSIPTPLPEGEGKNCVLQDEFSFEGPTIVVKLPESSSCPQSAIDKFDTSYSLRKG